MAATLTIVLLVAAEPQTRGQGLVPGMDQLADLPIGQNGCSLSSRAVRQFGAAEQHASASGTFYRWEIRGLEAEQKSAFRSNGIMNHCERDALPTELRPHSTQAILSAIEVQRQDKMDSAWN